MRSKCSMSVAVRCSVSCAACPSSNMSSPWKCSRNDIYEGFAVLAAAAGVWLLDASWPDLVIASALLVLFLRSGLRVFRAAWHAHAMSSTPQ